MKFPKLRGELTADAFVGMSKASSLEQVNAPYLSASGPGFTVRKKNGFTEVVPDPKKVEPAMPYLWAMGTPEVSGTTGFVTNDTYITDPRARKFKHLPNAGVLTTFAGAAFLNQQSLGVIESDSAALAVDLGYRLTTMTPNAGAGRPVTDFFQMVPRSLFVSGKSPAGVQWGMAARKIAHADLSTDTVDNSTKPILNAGFGATVANAPKIVRHTGEVVALPAEPESYRIYFGGAVHAAGEGRLLSLVVPRDSVASGVLKQTPPFIAESTDHGATWARVEVPALATLVRKVSAYVYPTTPVDLQDSEVLQSLGRTARFVYLGSGVSLLIANGLKTAGGTLFHTIFRYASGVLTRLAWGMDESRLLGVPNTALTQWFISGVTLNPAYDPPTFQQPDAMCFGPGCCAVQVTVGFDYRLRLTYDYGNTWSELTLPTAAGQGRFVVIRPYLSPEQPGRLVVISGTSLYQTDGTFSSFRLLGPVNRSGHSVGTPVWFRKRAKLYPELPNEY